jgi:hypothetical protein
MNEKHKGCQQKQRHQGEKTSSRRDANNRIDANSGGNTRKEVISATAGPQQQN